MSSRGETLRERIDQLKTTIEELQETLRSLEDDLATEENSTKTEQIGYDGSSDEPETRSPLLESQSKWPLHLDEYKRYGRQMILPQIGLEGQLRLKNARVLIIGMGGLGCPASNYLVRAGIGTIGLMDGDVVELSNLHRQILYTPASIGKPKVETAAEALRAINPHTTIHTHTHPLTPSPTTLTTFTAYDLILDCTDTPTSRYLISDTAVLARKPLISASALGTEGQLLTLNYPPAPHPKQGHCYRCIFPRAPPASSVQTCGEAGILGPVVGVMGVLMAGEAVRMVVRGLEFGAGAGEQGAKRTGMLMYSAWSETPFRSVRLRGRREGCWACSADAGITADTVSSESSGGDYLEGCGMSNAPTQTVMNREKIAQVSEVSPQGYAELRRRKSLAPMLIDVRPRTEFGICALPEAESMPISDLRQDQGELLRRSDICREAVREIIVVCRRGNDSRTVARMAMELMGTIVGDGAGGVEGGLVNIAHITGGLEAWSKDVDPAFPVY